MSVRASFELATGPPSPPSPESFRMTREGLGVEDLLKETTAMAEGLLGTLRPVPDILPTLAIIFLLVLGTFV